jgi:hypothetical protein
LPRLSVGVLAMACRPMVLTGLRLGAIGAQAPADDLIHTGETASCNGSAKAHSTQAITVPPVAAVGKVERRRLPLAGCSLSQSTTTDSDDHAAGSLLLLRQTDSLGVPVRGPSRSCCGGKGAVRARLLL